MSAFDVVARDHVAAQHAHAGGERVGLALGGGADGRLGRLFVDRANATANFEGDVEISLLGHALLRCNFGVTAAGVSEQHQRLAVLLMGRYERDQRGPRPCDHAVRHQNEKVDSQTNGQAGPQAVEEIGGHALSSVSANA
jgi:hypothetical protein